MWFGIWKTNCGFMAIIPIASNISVVTVGRNLSARPIVRILPKWEDTPMEGFITKKHFVLIWRSFGLRMALRVLTAKRGTTFLSLVAERTKK
jgi:hypothetical protein